MLDLSEKNILIVEDEEMNYIYLKQIFKITKGNITRVKTGNSAIEVSRKGDFDFILMDIQLPDMTGIDATKKIREFIPETPIIAQTASRTPDELEEVIECGCNDILVKPFKINDLTTVMEKYL